MTIPNFIEICIGNKYVIRHYKEGIKETEWNSLACEMTIDEWNEHIRRIKDIFTKESE